jgi:hypothetical protein
MISYASWSQFRLRDRTLSDLEVFSGSNDVDRESTSSALVIVRMYLHFRGVAIPSDTRDSGKSPWSLP